VKWCSDDGQLRPLSLSEIEHPTHYQTSLITKRYLYTQHHFVYKKVSISAYNPKVCMLLRTNRSNQDSIWYDPDLSPSMSGSQHNYLLTIKTLLNHNTIIVMVRMRRAVFTAKYNTNYNIFFEKRERTRSRFHRPQTSLSIRTHTQPEGEVK
jgi:hypothetical protein